MYRIISIITTVQYPQMTTVQYPQMVLSKYKVDGPQEESIGTWWLLPSAFAFENIGVTKTGTKMFRIPGRINLSV